MPYKVQCNQTFCGVDGTVGMASMKPDETVYITPVVIHRAMMARYRERSKDNETRSLSTSKAVLEEVSEWDKFETQEVVIER